MRSLRRWQCQLNDDAGPVLSKVVPQGNIGEANKQSAAAERGLASPVATACKSKPLGNTHMSY